MNCRTKQIVASIAFLSFASAGTIFPQCAAASNVVETSGDVLLGLIPAVAFGSTLYIKDTEGSMQFVKAFIANQAVTQGLKYTIHKDRPDESDDHSFPSGHTSTTFQAAAFIHKRYGWQCSIPAYLGAAFTGYSRVDADKHYVEDVLAGAVIGTISSFYFTEPYKGVTVAPAASRDYIGITLTARF
ncbi:MAG: PAP2 superfamily protein [Candidatus Electronema aureum]|uniref:PAP2 superfamily protein n=1 Tax=Candidatus Electronema aureum TaxID=2005002 RepID=A0A521G0Q1_9BACT|nr:MAG: PAP2 superfamily protein [Candidatus Electronema aureum]